MNLWSNAWTPMLLKEVTKPFNSNAYIYELKFDGIRAIIYVNKNCLKIVNRHNKDITHLFPELESIKELVQKDTVFDGEIVAMDEGFPSFLKLQNRLHLKDNQKIRYQSAHNPVIFIAFDILYMNKNLIDLPLEKRKSILNKYKDNDSFIKSKWIEEKGIELFNHTKKVNMEGIVAKKKDSLYQINTRSEDWLKIKNPQKGTFIIGGYKKNKNDSLSLFLGIPKEDGLKFVGKVMLGRKRELHEKILKQRKIKKSPFADYKEDCTYINPILECIVTFTEITENGHLRHPRIK